MENSYFSFDTYTVQLSSPPPTTSQLFELSGHIQGVTRVYLDTNLLSFAQKPYKVKLDWSDGPMYFDDVYIADTTIDTLSTFSPLLTSFFSHTYHPQSVAPYTQTIEFAVYYENGVIHEFEIGLVVSADNLIDHDLNVLSVQSIVEPNSTVLNVASQKGMVFCLADAQLEG